MWFRFPSGFTGCSIEQQSFASEFTDPEGHDYFRAPDHFAPKILIIPGFAQIDPPNGAPEDLPKADPLRDGAIAQLTRQIDAYKIEIEGLRSDLEAEKAASRSLSHERSKLASDLDKAHDEITALRERLEDAE